MINAPATSPDDETHAPDDAHDTDAERSATTVPTRPVKRSFSIKGHRTSISLEAAFWTALQEIAAEKASTLAGLVASIDATRGEAGLSSAVRIWVLEYYRSRGLPRSD